MLDRADLKASRSALLLVIRALLDRKEPTAAFDRAVASIDQVLSASADGTPEPALNHNEYVDTTEAAKALRCSDRRVRNIASRIGGIKLGGRWLIPKDALPELQHADMPTCCGFIG
jgi:hypothetical protein